jgi:hypothetical protein
VVREHEVGAGAADRGQDLEDRATLVEPAVRRRGFHHRVLATHVVGGHREARLVLRAPQNVEVGERRLHHHDVGAFVDVGADLADRLVGVRRIHLVPGPVAEPRRALGRLAERTVEGRSELRRVREDPDVEVSRLVERLADRRDLAVHHPARTDQVGASLGLRERDPPVPVERGVVVHAAVRREHAAVPVVGVLVEAEVRDDHVLVAELLPQHAQGLLRDAVRVPCL